MGRKSDKKKKKRGTGAAATTSRFNSANNLLLGARALVSSDPTEEQVREARQKMLAAIDLTLQDAALFQAEHLQHQHQTGGISDEEFEKQMDQALDNINSLGGNTPTGNGSRDFIYGLNGELIWLGE